MLTVAYFDALVNLRMLAMCSTDCLKEQASFLGRKIVFLSNLK
uniref:Uncharacterized protein n=1 Tax=Arundo donax TaxID=35708 RepID=A0A0A8YCM1_ARUDO